MQDVEVAARQLPWHAALASRHEPQVRAPDDVPRLVIAEVEPRDAAGYGCAALALIADREALVAGLCDERQPRAVRAPVHARHAVLQRREAPGLTSVERQHPGLGHRVGIADRRANEGQQPPVRRDGRRAVANSPARQLARSPAPVGTRPQVRLVPVAADPAEGVDDGGAVGCQSKGFERHLRPDECCGGRIGHGFEYARKQQHGEKS
jgi:hypothetical protein